MPTIAEIAEPESLAAAAKLHFQPPAAPREVVHEPKEPVANEPPSKPTEKPPAKVDPPPKPAAVKADARPAESKPKDEAETVFGTAPAKPKDAAPKDDDFEAKLAEETKRMKPKEQAAWNAIRREGEAAKQDARLAREELKVGIEARESKEPAADAPKLEAATARIAALELQLAEAEKSLSVTQVERSQKFRREVSEPMSELTKAAEDMAGRYEVSPKSILAALEEDPKTRADTLAELAADFKEGDRIDLYSIAKDMDRLRRNGERLREKAKADLSAMEQEDREAQDREAAAHRSTFGAAAQRAWDQAAKTLDFLRPNSAAPEWSAALDQARAQSAGYVPGEDPIADGQMIADAFQSRFKDKALEHFKSKLTAITEERDRLLERIKADNANDPALGGSRDEDAGNEGADDEGLNLGERTKLAAARMR